jgi:cellulose synthase/poly-beta-1,6-N-acetylglucosamine synthase-like glycosyltransferase
MNTITIGIAAYKEARTLPRALDALAAQRIPVDYEIILVSPDRATIAAGKKWSEEHKEVNFRTVRERERRGQAKAYNSILNLARGDIIFFTDADAIPGERAVTLILKAFADTEVGAACPRLVPLAHASAAEGSSNAGNSLYNFWAEVLYDIAHHRRLEDARAGRFYYLTGPLFAVRKEALLPRGIPEDTVVTDAAIGLIVRSRGWKVMYVPGAMVYNKYPTTLKDIILQKRRTLAGFYQLRRRYNSCRNVKAIGTDIENMKLRSFTNEMSGLIDVLGYARSPRECIYLLILFALRAYLWAFGFADIKLNALRRKPLHLWEIAESTKI